MPIRCLIYLFFLLVFFVNGIAQTTDTLPRHDDISVFSVVHNVWYYTGNPAKITMMPYTQSGKISAGYTFEDGAYQRIFQPRAKKYFHTKAEGYSKVGRVSFYGKMSYSYGRELDLKWNNVSFVSENNPFILSDSIGGDYDNELYFLEGKMASQTGIKNIKWGLGLKYNVGNKTDQTDPRPHIQSMRTSITPGLIISKDSWEFGVNLDAEKFKEEIKITVVDYLINYRYFRFKGFGQYQGTTDTYFERLYFGYKYGGAVQARYETPSFVNLSKIKAGNIYERAQEGATNTKYLAGDYKEFFLNVFDCMRFIKQNATHELKIDARFSKVKGIWFEQDQETREDETVYWKVYYESIKYKKQLVDLGLEYIFVKKKQGVTDFMLSGSTQYNITLADFYPEMFYEKIHNLTTCASSQKNWWLNSTNLSLKIGVAYRHNLLKNIYVEGIELQDKITYPEYYYYSADLAGLTGDIKAGFPKLFGDRFYPYFAFGYHSYYVINNNMYYENDYRVSWKIKTGFIF